MYKLVKKVLFRYDAEDVHYKVMKWLKKAYNSGLGKRFLISNYAYNDASIAKEVFGLKFKNPVGLAAGFDKDAMYVDELSCLGFGFIEIGTVTPKPQSGNERPRLFRLTSDAAIINRMGFNNHGVVAAAKRLKERSTDVIIGGNIGKNKTTPNDKAIEDYAICFTELFPVVDYFVVNVSSPNTPNLRELQEKEPLRNLLMHLQNLNLAHPTPKPILLKIAPDLSHEQIDDVLEIVAETRIAGLVATNTTIDRNVVEASEEILEEIGAGGLSGKPLRKKSTEIIKYINSKTNGSVPIIAVGGIFTGEDALEKLEAGASLVQVYTGFIYQGPTIVKDICKKIASV